MVWRNCYFSTETNQREMREKGVSGRRVCVLVSAVERLCAHSSRKNFSNFVAVATTRNRIFLGGWKEPEALNLFLLFFRLTIQSFYFSGETKVYKVRL